MHAHTRGVCVCVAPEVCRGGRATGPQACRYLRALSYFPNRAHTSTYERLMASLSHILEQTVPAGKSNQNPAYARASVLTEAAAVCLQIEATPLLKVCLAKVCLRYRPAAFCRMQSWRCNASAGLVLLCVVLRLLWGAVATSARGGSAGGCPRAAEVRSCAQFKPLSALWQPAAELRRTVLMPALSMGERTLRG